MNGKSFTQFVGQIPRVFDSLSQRFGVWSDSLSLRHLGDLKKKKKLACLVEELCLVPRTQVWWITTVYHSRGIQHTPLASVGTA